MRVIFGLVLVTILGISCGDELKRAAITGCNGREFRAAWVATVADIDWPKSEHDSTAKQKQDAIILLDRLADSNFNAIVFQVRDAGDAMYQSSIEPWSQYLTGHQGRAPSPLYDPLDFFIKESHKRNMEVHAWFNPYRAAISTSQTFASNHMAREFSQYAHHYGKNIWMDPGAKVVQDRAYDVITDVVTRYDIDGVHMDDYFYPYPVSGHDFPDSATYNSYKNSGGHMAKDDWRRDNVNKLIQRLSTGIKAIKQHVIFGISPFGIWKAGHPSGVSGLSSVSSLYADSQKWINEGWLDYLAPQLYWKIHSHQDYNALLGWWVQQNSHSHYIYAGLAVYRMSANHWPLSEIENQIEESRRLDSQLSCGNIFFSAKHFVSNDKGISDALKNKYYKTPALLPVNPWISSAPVPAPTGVKVIGHGFTWQADATGKVAKWVVYKKTGGTWEINQILPANAAIASADTGSYALTAVDKFHVESPKVDVHISSNPGIIG